MDKKKELRMTRQRRAILEELGKTKAHPSADDLYRVVRKLMPRISLGTVYRNLEVLTDLGLAKKIGPPESRTRYDGNLEDHYHFRCMNCGNIYDVPFDGIPEYHDAYLNGTKCEVTGLNVEMLGVGPICCRKKENPRKKSTDCTFETKT